MKHRFIFWMATALMALVAIGCNLDVPVEIEDIPEEALLKTVDIPAIIDGQRGGEGETKVAIANDGKFTWSEGDAVAMWTYSETFSGWTVSKSTKLSEDHKTATFTFDYTGTRSNLAIYPATIGMPGGYAAVFMPPTYDISDNLNSTTVPMPLAAENHEETTEFDFKHMGGLLRLTVNNVPPSAKTVSVAFFDSDGNKLGVVGQLAVSYDSENGYYLKASKSLPVNTVTFKVGTSLSWRDNVVLNIPLPTGTYHQITVSVYDEDGNEIPELTLSPKIYTNSTHSEGWTCTCGHGKKMTVALPAFLVNDTDTGVERISVASSNLAGFCKGEKFSPDNIKFDFMKYPWDVIERNGYPAIDPEYHDEYSGEFTSDISLFGWGTSNQDYYGASGNQYAYSIYNTGLYGPPYEEGRFLSVDAGSDWGCNIGKGYRTPTRVEFEHMMDYEYYNPGGMGGIINKDEDCIVYGYIILPFGCQTDNLPSHHTADGKSYGLALGFGNPLANLFYPDEWDAWEKGYGAVFLPCAGIRDMKDVDYVTHGTAINDDLSAAALADLASNAFGYGFYWTSIGELDRNDVVYGAIFDYIDGFRIYNFEGGYEGLTVRLVKTIE